MSDIRYQLSQLFEVAFGVKNPVFLTEPITIGTVASRDASYGNIPLNETQASGATSWMGTPMVAPLTFRGGIYQTYGIGGQLEDYPLNDFMLPAATLMDFTREKNIVRTSILGKNGTVKELYSFGDWKIRIRGLCLNDRPRQNDPTAEQQKQNLIAWEKVAGHISVRGNPLFNEKEIYAIVIGSITFRQLQGREGVVPFEIEAESDEPEELLL